MVGGAQEAAATSAATILNWDGVSWHRLILPKVLGTLWAISSGANNVLWMAGKDGLLITWDRTKGAFTQETIPNKPQLRGILAWAADNVWVVGGDPKACTGSATCGTIWQFNGTFWAAPAGLPTGWDTVAWSNVFGRSAKDVFITGMNGHVLHWDGSKWTDETVADAPLLAGSCSGSLCIAVGGTASGIIAEHDGAQWTRKSVAGLTALNGIWVNADGSAIGVGNGIWRRSTDGTWTADTDAPVTAAQFQSVYVDATGGAWAVGGDLSGYKTAALAHFGPLTIPAPATPTQ